MGGLADRLRIQNDFDRMHGLSGRTATEQELLTGSSFALAGGTQGTGFYTLWGRGAATQFDGREGGLSLDGEVTSGMLGADWTRDAITAGLVVSRSRGEGSYQGETGGGAITSTLTGAFPWGGYALSERLSVWGVTGFGQGRLTLTPEGQAPIETDLDLAMAAAGLRSVLAEAPETGGIELALKGDALGVRTGTARARGLEATETEATRLRLGLEGSRSLPFEGGASLTPSVEIGARLDGGDAETGFGVEIGGGLAWSDPRNGLSAELSGRGLLSHAADGFRKRGVSGSLSWDPTPASERGLELTMRQTVGAQSASGVDAIFEQGTLAGLAAGGIGEERRQPGATTVRDQAGLRSGSLGRRLHLQAGARLRPVERAARLQRGLAAHARRSIRRLVRSVARGEPAGRRERQRKSRARNRSPAFGTASRGDGRVSSTAATGGAYTPLPE